MARAFRSGLLLLAGSPTVHAFLIMSTMSSDALQNSWSVAAHGPAVSGQATASDLDGQPLAFGGLDPERKATSELWGYSAKGLWEQCETSGAAPSPRMYSAAATIGDAFIVTGGWDPGAPGSGGEFKDDAWRLDLRSKRWTQLEPMPYTASRHSATRVGSQVVVVTFRDGSVLVYDEAGQCRQQPTSGEAPQALSMCAAAPLGEHELVVFGGSTRTQAMSNDAYVLDTRSWGWRRLLLPAGADAPTPRGSACAAPIDGSSCIFFGGAGLSQEGYEGGAGLRATDETWLLRVDGPHATWERLETPNAPAPRVAASLSALPREGVTHFLLHGGWEPSTAATFDESHVLQL